MSFLQTSTLWCVVFFFSCTFLPAMPVARAQQIINSSSAKSAYEHASRIYAATIASTQRGSSPELIDRHIKELEICGPDILRGIGALINLPEASLEQKQAKEALLADLQVKSVDIDQKIQIFMRRKQEQADALMAARVSGGGRSASKRLLGTPPASPAKPAHRRPRGAAVAPAPLEEPKIPWGYDLTQYLEDVAPRAPHTSSRGASPGLPAAAVPRVMVPVPYKAPASRGSALKRAAIKIPVAARYMDAFLSSEPSSGATAPVPTIPVDLSGDGWEPYDPAAFDRATPKPLPRPASPRPASPRLHSAAAPRPRSPRVKSPRLRRMALPGSMHSESDSESDGSSRPRGGAGALPGAVPGRAAAGAGSRPVDDEFIQWKRPVEGEVAVGGARVGTMGFMCDRQTGCMCGFNAVCNAFSMISAVNKSGASPHGALTGCRFISKSAVQTKKDFYDQFIGRGQSDQLSGDTKLDTLSNYFLTGAPKPMGRGAIGLVPTPIDRAYYTYAHFPVLDSDPMLEAMKVLDALRSSGLDGDGIVRELVAKKTAIKGLYEFRSDVPVIINGVSFDQQDCLALQKCFNDFKSPGESFRYDGSYGLQPFVPMQHLNSVLDAGSLIVWVDMGDYSRAIGHWRCKCIFKQGGKLYFGCADSLHPGTVHMSGSDKMLLGLILRPPRIFSENERILRAFFEAS